METTSRLISGIQEKDDKMFFPVPPYILERIPHVLWSQ